jgi:hypothetical protein
MHRAPSGASCMRSAPALTTVLYSRQKHLVAVVAVVAATVGTRHSTDTAAATSKAPCVYQKQAACRDRAPRASCTCRHTAPSLTLTVAAATSMPRRRTAGEWTLRGASAVTL